MALDVIDEAFGGVGRPSELGLAGTHAFPNVAVMLRYLR